MKKISVWFLVLSLILGITSFAPTISAKTKYDTLAFDKKLETKQDFEKGEFKNAKLEEKNGGIEMSAPAGERGEYITPVIEAPFGATHIGLHWKENIADDASITAFVRTSEDGVNFGDWTEAMVELDEGRNDMKNEEIFAALVGAEKTKFAQAKIEFPADAEKNIKLNQLTFTFLNSAEESSQTSKKLSLVSNSLALGGAVEKTSPGGQSVAVISREEWGANESYRFDRKGNEEWPRSYHGTRKIIVHHTAVASSNGVTDIDANMAAVRSTYYYHAVTQKWGDIGYSALVDAAGRVYEGRYGTHGTSPTRTNPTADQIMTLDVEAGHTAGYNSGSFGVSAMGDFTSFGIPADQKEGLKKAMAFVADSRGIDIQGKSDFLRYDGIWKEDMYNVAAHRDVGATACPGDKLWDQMTTIKSETDNLPGILSNLDNFHATMNGVNISGTSIGIGTLNFSWDAFPNATEYQYVLERVYGTTGVASDSEPWETAWFNPENANAKTISGTSVSVEAGDLQTNSQYVFYVRALGVDGNPISTTKHVNFQRDSSTAPVAEDTIAPIANILNPADGATVSGIVSVKATATDNVDVVLFELSIDGKKVASATTGTLSYNWNTKKASRGTHTIVAKAYDAAGNVGTTSITVTK
ncbi:MAG: Ig-like domain-containing protein [Candidatus Moraniibacteriota bacterium]